MPKGPKKPASAIEGKLAPEQVAHIEFLRIEIERAREAYMKIMHLTQADMFYEM